MNLYAVYRMVLFPMTLSDLVKWHDMTWSIAWPPCDSWAFVIRSERLQLCVHGMVNLTEFIQFCSCHQTVYHYSVCCLFVLFSESSSLTAKRKGPPAVGLLSKSKKTSGNLVLLCYLPIYTVSQKTGRFFIWA